FQVPWLRRHVSLRLIPTRCAGPRGRWPSFVLCRFPAALVSCPESRRPATKDSGHMAQVKIGKFQVIGTLGTGAHSTTLHVRRNADGRFYALKVVPIADKDELKYLEQARHEFQVAQMLDHPHLIKIYALETQSDWLFRVRKVHLLIEYVNGKTLD